MKEIATKEREKVSDENFLKAGQSFLGILFERILNEPIKNRLNMLWFLNLETLERRRENSHVR